MRSLRTPLVWLYAGLVRLNNFLYDRGLRTIDRLDRPVISVGNLAMGGAGKTPICVDLARRLSGRGLRVAVLSRGYKRRDPKTPRRAMPDGDWRDYGDEPTMIARRLPDVWVGVAAARVDAAELARPWRPDVYLLDDGFQHRRLHRDFDLVLLDVTRDMPSLVARDLFRERWPALRRAHAVALTRWDGRDTAAWEAKIRGMNPRAALLRVGFEPRRLLTLDGRDLGLESLRGRRVAAFAGLAEPGQFFKSLERLGAELALTRALADHQPLEGEGLRRFLDEAEGLGAELIVCTEKDAVKLERTAASAILLCFLAVEPLWEAPDRLERILGRVLGKDNT